MVLSYTSFTTKWAIVISFYSFSFNYFSARKGLLTSFTDKDYGFSIYYTFPSIVNSR